MGTTEPCDLLRLLRLGARNLLEIPSDSTEEEVRRRCLLRLEDQEFHPDDDIDTAIRILCGDPSRWTGLPPNAPQFARHVERLVRGELERIALRLRTEPGEEVRPALEAIRETTELFPSTELWRTRLVQFSRASFPHDPGEGSSAQILAALVESATTWPGEAAKVRRKHLELLAPRGRFAPAARMLCKKYPDLKQLDPLLLAAIDGTAPPRPVRRTDATAQEPPKKSLAERWMSIAFLLLVFVPMGIGMWSRPPRAFQATPPPPSTPIQVSRLPGSDPVSRSLFDKPSSTPIPGHPLFPAGGSPFGTKLYAPWSYPIVPGLAPGERVTVLPMEGDRSLFFVPETRKAYRVPKRDILDAQYAFSDLHDRTAANPGDALGWVAYANVAMEVNDPSTANKCYEQATRLGINLGVKTVNGKDFWIPALALRADTAPLIPPPPPLPTLVGEGAP